MTPEEPSNTPSDPEPPTEELRERRLAQAVAEYLDLQAREESIDPDTFCLRYPDLEQDLRRELETISDIGELLGEAAVIRPSESGEPLPERLSGHRILGLIGSGGMGQVLLAQDEALGRKVAIKILAPRFRDDPRIRNRFMQEARAMAQLSHPDIVRIYSLGPPEEMPHFVMEHVTGAPLTEAGRTLTFEQKAELIRKIALAVEFLHQNGIIHRDLKPRNILVGADLEPKLLDFGLARRVEESPNRITLAGEVMGTPDYFSPEQARGDASLDARSDIFSLGAIFYELLAGVVPFRSENLSDQTRMLRELDPALPRRIDPSIPGELQNICLKCLEKQPPDRYGSARELANDLERFLAGEPVLASPTSYSRMMAGRIEQHLRELKGWEQDRIVSVYELDAFRRLYDRLFEREDAWILEVRRLSLSQVSLYLGAWVLVIAAALVFLFRYPDLNGTPAVLVDAAAAAATAWVGIRCWKQGQMRIGVAYLLAFCLLLPITMLVGMKEWRLLTQFTHGKQERELFCFIGLTGSESGGTFTTNAQLWWAIVLSLPVYVWLRRFTRSTVFSLVLATMSALLCIATLLRMGMIDWLETDRGQVYFRLMAFAALFFLLANGIERIKAPGDSRYFYPFAVLFTFIALSGVAADYEPNANRLERVFPWTRGQIEYLFIINAGIYLVLQRTCEGFGSSQMRMVAKAFRFVIPGHVLTSVWLLGVFATRRWHDSSGLADLREARFFEFLLPVLACLFVFGSIPNQMKNYFVWGLGFLAIGIIRLQQNFFKDHSAWPIGLLVTGLSLMILAANYTRIKFTLLRWLRRKPFR